MKGLFLNKKAIISIFTLFFVLSFILLLTGDQREGLKSFQEIKLAQTQIKSFEYNLEQVIKNQMNNKEDNEIIIKSNINKELEKFLIQEKNLNIKIHNIKENKEENINFKSLQSISKLIIYKPTKNILVKEYTITNGINKSDIINYSLETKNLSFKKSIPLNFSVKVIVYT